MKPHAPEDSLESIMGARGLGSIWLERLQNHNPATKGAFEWELLAGKLPETPLHRDLCGKATTRGDARRV